MEKDKLQELLPEGLVLIKAIPKIQFSGVSFEAEDQRFPDQSISRVVTFLDRKNCNDWKKDWEVEFGQRLKVLATTPMRHVVRPLEVTQFAGIDCVVTDQRDKNIKSLMHDSDKVADKLKLFQQLLEGINELHRQGIVHGAICAEYVQYSRHKNNQIQCQLVSAEWGMVHVWAKGNGREINEYLQTYYPPEWNSGPEGSREGDVYAAGIIGCELFADAAKISVYKNDQQELKKDLRDKNLPKFAIKVICGLVGQKIQNIDAALEKFQEIGISRPKLVICSVVASCLLISGGYWAMHGAPLAKENSANRVRNSELADSNKGLQDTIRTQLEDITNKKEQADSFKTLWKAASDSLIERNDAVTTLTTAKQNLTKHNDDLEIQVADFNKMIEVFTNGTEVPKAVLDEAQKQIADLNSDLKQLQDDNTALMTEKDKLTADKVKFSATNASLTTENKQYAAKVGELESKLNVEQIIEDKKRRALLVKAEVDEIWKNVYFDAKTTLSSLRSKLVAEVKKSELKDPTLSTGLNDRYADFQTAAIFWREMALNGNIPPKDIKNKANLQNTFNAGALEFLRVWAGQYDVKTDKGWTILLGKSTCKRNFDVGRQMFIYVDDDKVPVRRFEDKTYWNHDWIAIKAHDYSVGRAANLVVKVPSGKSIGLLLEVLELRQRDMIALADSTCTGALAMWRFHVKGQEGISNEDSETTLYLTVKDIAGPRWEISKPEGLIKFPPGFPVKPEDIIKDPESALDKVF